MELSTSVLCEHVGAIFGRLKKIFLTAPSSIDLFIYLYLMSTSLVCDVVVLLLIINMIPTLSALTMTGHLTEIIRPICFSTPGQLLTDYE